jgi:hypothetical protein
VQNESKIGGILSIISGVIGILSISIYILGIFAFYYMSQNSYYYAFPLPEETMKIAYIFYGATGIIMFLLDILAIIGGVFALKMKNWGWSLAGAISATLTFFPCGVAALILISKSQAAYNQPIPYDPNQLVKPNP